MSESHFHILCIDDDEFMLKATHRLLRRLKPEWEMDFISDPLSWEQHVDPNRPPALILSDLLMPKLQGDELLKQVAQRFPRTVRALITGDSSRDIPALAGANVHFILPKPFTEDDFSYVLDSVERLSHLPLSDEARDKLAGFEDLPVLPSRIRKIHQALRDTDSDLSHIALMVSEEPALVARLLQLANSAYLGFGKPTMSVEVAVNRLGTTVTGALATCMLSQKVFSQVSAQEHQEIVERYLKLAGLSRNLSKHLNVSKSRQESTYLAALMSALGELVVMEMGGSQDDIDTLSTIEPGRRDAFVITSYILILWGYSLDIANIVLASEESSPMTAMPENEGQIIRLCHQWMKLETQEKQNEFCQQFSPQIGHFFQDWPE